MKPVAPKGVVLVVEDDAHLREMLVFLLEGEGYPVHAAEDGAAAIQLLEEYAARPGHLSLVLLNMMIPVVEGPSVLQYIAWLGSSVPVVAW